MLGTNACRDIGVQIIAAELGRMAVNVLTGEKLKLGHGAWIAVDDTGKVHEFGQSDDALMILVGRQIVSFDLRARGFHICRRHTAG